MTYRKNDIPLSPSQLNEFISEIQHLPVTLKRIDNKIQILSAGNTPIAEIILPLYQEAALKDDFAGNAFEEGLNYLVVLVQAGLASLGAFEKGEMLYHKVIRKYMVRKCQGKTQIKHLREKGKSREGSRIRLRQTEEFIDEIRETLGECKDIITESGILFYSCDVRLFSEIFPKDSKPVFVHAEPRFIKIPFHVHQPNYKELVHVNYSLTTGKLSFLNTDDETVLKLENIISEILI